ncbi:hypothetical protein BHM03_00060118 [Ensete ventricosum]|nr:hypothetical protein BHM03_00060118 [Ensete ventricosum]
MGRGSDDVVGNSPGVYRELAKGIESLLGWRKGVRRKKIETRRKIIECLTMTVKRSYRSDMDPGSSLSIGVRFGRCGGSSLGVRLDFAKGIGRSLGTCREIVGGRP